MSNLRIIFATTEFPTHISLLHNRRIILQFLQTYSRNQHFFRVYLLAAKEVTIIVLFCQSAKSFMRKWLLFQMHMCSCVLALKDLLIKVSWVLRNFLSGEAFIGWGSVLKKAETAVESSVCKCKYTTQMSKKC